MSLQTFCGQATLWTKMGSPSILIVEDFYDTCCLLQQIFEHAGFAVDVVASGEEALVALPQRRPDVIVMDLHLPGIGGVEATRRLRSYDEFRAIPIIAYTAYAPEALDRQLFDAVCLKPSSPDALVSVSRALFMRTRNRANAITGSAADTTED